MDMRRTRGISAARSYWDNKPPYFSPKKFSIPAAFTVFPGEIYQPSRRWAEGGYPNLVRRPTSGMNPSLLPVRRARQLALSCHWRNAYTYVSRQEIPRTAAISGGKRAKSKRDR
jgi:hypothetical protein